MGGTRHIGSVPIEDDIIDMQILSVFVKLVRMLKPFSG